MAVFGPVALAFVAGVVSIASPCCLPLLPGYLSYVSAVSDADAGDAPKASRRRVVIAAILFVAGFSLVFTALGATATVFGSLVLGNRPLFERIGGIFIVAMGLITIGLLRVPFLQRQYRIDLSRIRPGPGGAFPLGMAFAIGWTPCIGPVLAAILTLAAGNASPLVGAGLLWVYSLGLGIPFLALAVGQERARRSFAWVRRHTRQIEVAGGVVLIAMGVLMTTGLWNRAFGPVIGWFTRNNWPPI